MTSFLFYLGLGYTIGLLLLLLMMLPSDQFVNRHIAKYQYVFNVYMGIVYVLALFALTPIVFIVEGFKGAAKHVVDFTNLYTQALKK